MLVQYKRNDLFRLLALKLRQKSEPSEIDPDHGNPAFGGTLRRAEHRAVSTQNDKTVAAQLREIGKKRSGMPRRKNQRSKFFRNGAIDLFEIVIDTDIHRPYYKPNPAYMQEELRKFYKNIQIRRAAHAKNSFMEAGCAPFFRKTTYSIFFRSCRGALTTPCGARPSPQQNA